jgi:hypothetical protein
LFQGESKARRRLITFEKWPGNSTETRFCSGKKENNYWASSEMMAAMQETHFRKNLAIMGGLLMLAYSGPGKWAGGQRNSH